MDKNTIIGFVLIAAVLIGFSWWSQPTEQQKAEARAQFVRDSIAAVKKQQKETSLMAQQAKVREQAAKDTAALFHNALGGDNELITLSNKKLALTLSSKGAMVSKAVIKGYKGHNLKFKDGSHDAPDVTLSDVFRFDEKTCPMWMSPDGYGNISSTYFFGFEPSSRTLSWPFSAQIFCQRGSISCGL